MSQRTILDLENGKSSPRAETAFLITSELDISLDAILYDENSDAVSPAVFEFFYGKTSEESNSQTHDTFCNRTNVVSQDTLDSLALCPCL